MNDNLKYSYTMRQLRDMDDELLLTTYSQALLYYENEDVYFILSNLKGEIMDRMFRWQLYYRGDKK